MYLDGVGVSQNNRTAFNYFEKGAAMVFLFFSFFST